jgi:hypothetical protein
VISRGPAQTNGIARRGAAMKRTPRVGMTRESMIKPALEKPLLGLHAAMNVDALWKATQRLLSAAIPNRVIGLALQHKPSLPMIVRWTLPMPDGFFTAVPIENYIAGRPRHRFVRISGLFPNRSSLIKSTFYSGNLLEPSGAFAHGATYRCRCRRRRRNASIDKGPAPPRILAH